MALPGRLRMYMAGRAVLRRRSLAPLRVLETDRTGIRDKPCEVCAHEHLWKNTTDLSGQVRHWIGGLVRSAQYKVRSVRQCAQHEHLWVRPVFRSWIRNCHTLAVACEGRRPGSANLART